MRFYSSHQIYNPKYRYYLNSITKSQWNERSAEERRRVYGKWVDLFEYTPEIKEADICLLTYQWNYYVENDRVAEAAAEAEAARAAGKALVIFCGGDFPARLPFDNVILFEFAGYRSDPGFVYHSAQPTALNDYVREYCAGTLKLREKQEIPVVGFCGQASTSPLQTAWRRLRLAKCRFDYEHGRSRWEPPPFETTAFRARVLRAFEKPGIRTNYLARRQYQAGKSKTLTDQSKERIEFVRNILESDYTLCMRGGGNYSVRFYETLCLGRIPVFIDTDCLLPFQDMIDYKSIFPWIDAGDLPHAAEYLRDFHAKLTNDEFIDLQKICRSLWIKHMTPDGFYSNLHTKLRELLTFNDIPINFCHHRNA